MSFIEEVVIPFFVICIVAVGTVIIIDYKSCETYSEMTERETIHRVFGGCFVKYGDRVIPKEEYKYVEVKDEPSS